MKFYLLFIYMCISLLVVCTACSTTINQQMEQTSIEDFDSLQSVYYGLTDSLNQVMEAISEDKEKRIADMLHLLHELKGEHIQQEDSLATLTKEIEALKSLQYAPLAIANAENIEKYDSVLQAKSEVLVNFAESKPEFEQNQVIPLLAERVLDAHTNLLVYRLQYDRLSQEYNHFLDEYRNLIGVLDSSDNPVHKRPVYKLVNEEN